MKIEIIDGAGKRITDGSSIALLVLSVVPVAMPLFDGTAMTTSQKVLVGVAVLGAIFKFIKVTW